MKHLEKALALSTILALTVFTGCSDDDDNGTGPAVDEFQTLVDHTDNYVGGWTSGWIQSATYVHDNLANLFVIDLRSADAYAAGHIPGAVNGTPATAAALAATAGSRTVALVCYSGQTAAWTTMALRMLGFDDAFSMSWGMSGWHTDFMAPWEGGIGSAYVADFVTTASPALPVNDAPSLDTGESTAEGILAARVAATLAAGFPTIGAADVMATPGDFNILNYWADSDYLGYGHIDGALQVSPGTLTSDQNLLAMDPGGDNVIYCWTGQTSALMTFYLSALGYETHSLRYGANSMIYSELTAHNWPIGGPGLDYAYDTANPVSEFELLSEATDAAFAGWTTSWIKDVVYVHDMQSDLFILDLRSAADYAAGHIEGAVNATLTTMLSILDEQNADDAEVAAVCYTGQTASFATMALRMAGWNAFAMKYGMAAWNQDYSGSWDNGISSDFSSEMVNDASPALPTNAFPTLNTGLTSADAILAAQLEAVLTEGFGANAVTADAVFATPGDYTVFNYWSQADYEDLGHIPGSYQLTPGSVTSDANLSALDPAGTNVIYCWTGQTSALTTAYLSVMGYDVKSLKFGANGMMYDGIAGHTWPEGGFADYNYPVVTD